MSQINLWVKTISNRPIKVTVGLDDSVLALKNAINQKEESIYMYYIMNQSLPDQRITKNTTYFKNEWVFFVRMVLSVPSQRRCCSCALCRESTLVLQRK